MGALPILVIEDSLTQATRLKLELQRHHLTVVLARSGQEGLQRAHERLPAAIVLDIDLPDMSGIEVCRALKQEAHTAEVPVLMMTNYDDAASIMQAINHGAVDYIPKDAYAEQNLIAALRQLGILTKEATP